MVHALQSALHAAVYRNTYTIIASSSRCLTKAVPHSRKQLEEQHTVVVECMYTHVNSMYQIWILATLDQKLILIFRYDTLYMLCHNFFQYANDEMSNTKN